MMAVENMSENHSNVQLHDTFLYGLMMGEFAVRIEEKKGAATTKTVEIEI